MARKATIEKSAFLKINTGNFESVDVHMAVKEEIEFETPQELVEKTKKLDNMLIALLKNEAEASLTQMGRHRIMKINGVETPVELWKSYVQEGIIH